MSRDHMARKPKWPRVSEWHWWPQIHRITRQAEKRLPGDILGVGGESGVKCISGSDLSPVSNGGKQINEKIKLVHSKELLN